MQELFTEDASVKVEMADQSANPAPAENSASPEHVAVNVTLQLPPMPEPNSEEMSSQACGGICCVTTLILGELAFAHFVVVILGKPGLVVTIIFLSIMWLDAIFAVICLLYILNGDPGEVSRSPEVSCAYASHARCEADSQTDRMSWPRDACQIATSETEEVSA